jgi:hypothetical protein
MGSFERFKTKTHFNSLKRLVGVTALGALAVKLLAVALATAASDGTPLDLLLRVPACVADLGAALLVFEVLRTRRSLQLAARSAILVAVSPVLFVASGIHVDRLGVAVALLAMYLLIDRDAPLVAVITLAIASRVEPMVLLAAPVAMAAITARTAPAEPADPAAARSRFVHFAGALAGALFAAWVPTLAWNWDSLAPARPRPRLGAEGPGLAGRVRLPGRRPLGQHLRGRRRGHTAVDHHLVGVGNALGRRGRPRDRPGRARGRSQHGHLGGPGLLAVPWLAHGRGRVPVGRGRPGGCGQPGAPVCSGGRS